MKDRLEAILFAAGRYVDEDRIAKLLSEDIRKVRKELLELKKSYDARPETSLQVVQEENSWKLHVKDTYLELVSKLVSEKEIATTVLETLAIVAWKNPALQAEIIKIRGPAAYEHISELIERGFVIKEPSGRTFKLRVTDKFFEYFDVEGRDDLRKVFKDVEEQAAAQHAVVEAQKQEYELQKKIAAAAQEALDQGKQLSPEELAKLKETLSTASAPSAQTAPLPSPGEIKKVVDETKEDAAETAANEIKTEDLVRDVKEDLKEFKDDVDKLDHIDAAVQAAKKKKH